MGVYISFYKSIPININNKRQVNVIREQLIQQELKSINTPVKSPSNYRGTNTFLEELEANRLKHISTKKKEIKWLRKASCKQVISKAYEIDLWQFANTLYTVLDDLYFPIGYYLTEDKYNITFKNCMDFCEFIQHECSSHSLMPKDQEIIYQFFNKYDKKGLIQIY